MYERGGGEELVGTEEQNTIIRIYFVTKEFIFNKRDKYKKIKLFHESLRRICILYLTFDWH